MAPMSPGAWLRANPEFEQRPATLAEFLGPHYLNIEAGVRDSIKDVLGDIMGEDVNPDRPTEFPLAMFTGAIGIGKTTVASIVLPYLVHWCLCLKDPQSFFGLLPGTRIAFMLMSTNAKQAKEVLFADINGRLRSSPWFQGDGTAYRPPHLPDDKIKSVLKFEKDIWIIPGDSAETTFEGYNILGGIIDEMDSHQLTKETDYAELGFDTIYNRMYSRFQDRGFIMLIGQMKKSTGFASRKYEEFSGRSDAYVARLTIWESMGEQFYRDRNGGEYDTFFYDVSRKMIVPGRQGLLVAGSLQEESNVLEIPKMYLENFKNEPEKALKDLAGIPPMVGDPFISSTFRIQSAQDRWHENQHPEPPVDKDGRVAGWFKALNAKKRTAHVDVAYSGDGDALGMAMGHVSHQVEIDGELKPYIVIDYVHQMVAPSGQEIQLVDMRRALTDLRDRYGFKLKTITFDTFQSTSTMQELERKRFRTETVSVDKDKGPYYDLREAILEERIEFPRYMVKPRGAKRNSGQLIDILYKELSELTEEDRKIDHPPIVGSKDVADALAGVVFTLMGDRRYHQGTKTFSDYNPATITSEPEQLHKAYLGSGQSMTLPSPTVPSLVRPGAPF